MAAYDFFLKIDGIPGEAQDKAHKGEIDILSYSWGMVQHGTSATGGGMGAGRVKVHDITFIKTIDKASPKLFEACATGKHIKSAQFTCRKAGGTAIENWTISFTDLLISSVQHVRPTSDSSSTSSLAATISLLPEEQIMLNFSSYEVTYKEQQSDGTAGGAIQHKYNLKTNS